MKIWVPILYCKLPFRKLVCLFKGHKEIVRWVTNKGIKPSFNGYVCLYCHKHGINLTDFTDFT